MPWNHFKHKIWKNNEDADSFFFCPKSTEHIYVYCDNERSLSSLVRLFIDMQIK